MGERVKSHTLNAGTASDGKKISTVLPAFV